MISVIVPVLNEADNIEPLLAELDAAGRVAPIREIIYVDDGSSDATSSLLQARMRDYPALRVLHHGRRLGQSAAFLTGAREATQELLVLIDGDGQNDPADIALLYAAYGERSRGNPAVAILGQRATRKDSMIRRISSHLANRLRAAVLNDGTRDTGCSLKLIRRQDYLAMPYFNHMHRFLPALLLRNGVALAHVDVSHRQRLRGQSKYGFWNRALVGAVDLVGVAWLIRRRLPPDYATSQSLKSEMLP